LPFPAPINNQSYRTHKLENLLQFEIVTFVAATVMHRTEKYFITFTPRCFVLAVAAVCRAGLRAILLNKICKN